MGHNADLARVRQQAGILAEQVVCLVDVIARHAESGVDVSTTPSKADVLEQLLRTLSASQARLNNLPH